MTIPTTTCRQPNLSVAGRRAPGLQGAAIDPNGPAIDVLGNADPWQDLWFYTNPIFVLPKAK